MSTPGSLRPCSAAPRSSIKPFTKSLSSSTSDFFSAANSLVFDPFSLIFNSFTTKPEAPQTPTVSNVSGGFDSEPAPTPSKRQRSSRVIYFRQGLEVESSSFEEVPDYVHHCQFRQLPEDGATGSEGKVNAPGGKGVVVAVVMAAGRGRDNGVFDGIRERKAEEARKRRATEADRQWRSGGDAGCVAVAANSDDHRRTRPTGGGRAGWESEFGGFFVCLVLELNGVEF
ncbi:hypothetical protein CRG98_010149 [Punica granatum]|uniref:Uncharacterized protein n=1 Tax=Punica granatum TaxID=22663 RepID=A0A2I0KNN8_PUNGR|nr:hypothetical protein CRG98_010149 [Punica granatum]